VNMNKTVVLSALMAAAIFVSGPLFAQGKIAVLDARGAIMATKDAQARIKKIQANPEFAANVKELEKLRKEHDEILKKVQKDSATLSKDQQQAEIKKISDKRADMEHVARKLQAAEQQLTQDLYQEFAPKMQQVVADIIKADGIGLLLNREAVVHAEQSYNITAKVTEKLDQAK
jgi:outer membrane protein